MKTNSRKSFVAANLNVAVVGRLILAVAIGCKGVRKNNQPTRIHLEQKTVGTITYPNTGGSCSKNINGQSIHTPRVGFSYSVNGTSYNGMGCTYNLQTVAGDKINVCYDPDLPNFGKPCGE